MAEGPKPVGHLTQFCKIPEMSRVIRITAGRDLKQAPHGRLGLPNQYSRGTGAA